MSSFLKQYGQCSGPFGFPMFEEDARALDVMLEDSDGDDIGHFRIAKAGFEHFIDGEKADVSTITDDSVDITKEAVDITSVNWDIFRKRGGLVAFNHKYDIPPIGRSLWQRLVNKKWKAKTAYASRPDTLPKDTEWFPDSIYHMVKSGYLPGKSIGGIGKRREPDEEDVKKNAHWKEATTVIYDSVIYEYSVVPVMANTNAIVEAVSKGLVTLPSAVLTSDFPEVKDMVEDLTRQHKESHPVIKSFRTGEVYAKELDAILSSELSAVMDRTPEIVDNIFKRLLGKV